MYFILLGAWVCLSCKLTVYPFLTLFLHECVSLWVCLLSVCLCIFFEWVCPVLSVCLWVCLLDVSVWVFQWVSVCLWIFWMCLSGSFECVCLGLFECVSLWVCLLDVSVSASFFNVSVWVCLWVCKSLGLSLGCVCLWLLMRLSGSVFWSVCRWDCFLSWSVSWVSVTGSVFGNLLA